MDELEVGTPGVDEDYLVAHHPHPTHQQQQQMHMQQQHMRARELELENVGASGSAMAGTSTQTGYDPSSASASALNPTAALPMDQSFDEEPLYVNAKQYYRILKRRMARQRLDELHRLSRQRKVCIVVLRVPKSNAFRPAYGKPGICFQFLRLNRAS